MYGKKSSGKSMLKGKQKSLPPALKKKILALILARKNSKRLPGKNLRKIGNKSLVEWSINSIKNIDGIIDVLVSSDDKRIINIAKKKGSLAPFVRPRQISKDNTSSEETSMHAINWYEKNVAKLDGFFLLQPTTPFRSRAKLKKAIMIFNKKVILKLYLNMIFL